MAPSGFLSDFATRRLWLAVDGQECEAAIPATILSPHQYLAVVFGNTQEYDLAAQEPWEGLLDEIAILDVSYPHARSIFNTNKVYTERRPQPPLHRAQ